VAGSTLYIPVFAKGALFEIGDGHGAQGDGEVDQTGLETGPNTADCKKGHEADLASGRNVN
jgi:acetamidase/formamidase